MPAQIKKTTKQAWSAEDRQRFADRNILKSKKVPKKRKCGPTSADWE